MSQLFSDDFFFFFKFLDVSIIFSPKLYCKSVHAQITRLATQNILKPVFFIKNDMPTINLFIYLFIYLFFCIN